jgi:hypothetical protein
MCNWQKGTSRKILPYPNFAGRKCLQYQNMTCVIILLGVKKKPNRRRDGLHEFGHVRADLNNQKANKMTGFWRKGFMAAAMVIGLLGAASALAQENPSTNARRPLPWKRLPVPPRLIRLLPPPRLRRLHLNWSRPRRLRLPRRQSKAKMA